MVGPWEGTIADHRRSTQRQVVKQPLKLAHRDDARGLLTVAGLTCYSSTWFRSKADLHTHTPSRHQANVQLLTGRRIMLSALKRFGGRLREKPSQREEGVAVGLSRYWGMQQCETLQKGRRHCLIQKGPGDSLRGLVNNACVVPLGQIAGRCGFAAVIEYSNND